MPVINQSFLQISFVLCDGFGNYDHMTLPINPEELTRTEPSRTAVTQTLDGAFVDSFGRGLTTLTISGNTGWGQGARPEGGRQFTILRDNFIHAWHDARQECIDNGDDPNKVRLIFIDALNNKYVADVVPTQFVLRRNKLQPLLLLYNITLQVIAENAENRYPELMEKINTSSKIESSFTSMSGSIGDLFGSDAASRMVARASSVVTAVSSAASGGGLIGLLDGLSSKIGTLGQSALGTVKSTFWPVMETAAGIIATAKAAGRVLTEAEQAAVDVARELAGTATKVFDAVGAVAGLPNDAVAAIMQVKREYSNLGCLLSNGFANAIGNATAPLLPYGASNCSSTAGGSTPSDGSNPFVAPITSDLITTTPGAVSAINAINALDPTQPIDQATLAGLLDIVSAGITVPGFVVAVPATQKPIISYIRPNAGMISGGTTLRIVGRHLAGATGVTVGGVACTGLSSNTATSLTCIVPAGAAGNASVVVTTVNGANDANSLFVYVSPIPIVTSISPTIGSTAGGTAVTITGANLTGVTGVTVGGVACTSVLVVSPTSITCIVPAGLYGFASVLVTTPGGTNVANTLFSYSLPTPTPAPTPTPSPTPEPTVTSIIPNDGRIIGGTLVTITGTNLINVTNVFFGEWESPIAPSSISQTQLACVSPSALEIGYVDVVVKTNYNGLPSNPGVRFRYWEYNTPVPDQDPNVSPIYTMLGVGYPTIGGTTKCTLTVKNPITETLICCCSYKNSNKNTHEIEFASVDVSIENFKFNFEFDTPINSVDGGVITIYAKDSNGYMKAGFTTTLFDFSS
jgi:hypothetical protein